MAATLAIIARVRLGPRSIGAFRRAAVDGWPIAIGIALSQILYMLSIASTTVADSLLMQGTAPIFIVVMAWIFLRERVRAVTVGALVAIVTGTLLILIPSLDRGGFSGNLLGLAKAVAFAVAAIAMRKKRTIELLPAVTVAALIAAAVSLVMAPSLRVSSRQLLVLAYMGVFQMGISFALFTIFSGRLPASISGLLVILEAVIGPIWVWVFLAEKPAAWTLAGGAVIIAALVVHSIVYGSQPRRA